MNEAQEIRLGNVYDDRFGQSYGGNVWGVYGISPTLKSSGSRGQDCVVVEVSDDRTKNVRSNG